MLDADGDRQGGGEGAERPCRSVEEQAKAARAWWELGQTRRQQQKGRRAPGWRRHGAPAAL